MSVLVFYVTVLYSDLSYDYVYLKVLLYINSLNQSKY